MFDVYAGNRLVHEEQRSHRQVTLTASDYRFIVTLNVYTRGNDGSNTNPEKFGDGVVGWSLG